MNRIQALTTLERHGVKQKDWAKAAEEATSPAVKMAAGYLCNNPTPVELAELEQAKRAAEFKAAASRPKARPRLKK